jgi:CubicO group peptidase (beta-lactamase class C family)
VTRVAATVLAATEQEADRLRGAPGVCVAALPRPDAAGVVVCRGRASLPDGPVLTARTLVEIGSVTKVITSLALADAVLRGEATLDTPVRALLPAGTTAPTAGGREITLEHLATHTSGLPRSPLGPTAEWRRADPYSRLTTQDVLDCLGRARLSRPPGSRRSYSNFGAAVLGLALAAATGFPAWEAMVRDRVLDPLGLHDTVLNPSEEQATRMATGHRWRQRPTPGWHLDGLAPAGGLLSTADDMVTFARSQLTPDQTPLAGAIRLAQHRRGEHRGSGYGLGWSWTLVQGGWLLWHNGGTAGFRSFLGVDPGRGTAAVVLLTAFSLRGGDLAGIRLLRALGT